MIFFFKSIFEQTRRVNQKVNRSLGNYPFQSNHKGIIRKQPREENNTKEIMLEDPIETYSQAKIEKFNEHL